MIIKKSIIPIKKEFESGPASKIKDKANQNYKNLTGRDGLGAINYQAGIRYYTLIRKLKPEVAIETGVCNGFSTLCILLGLKENGFGFLHSIDFPHQSDESLEEFRNKTFDGYGGAAIPPNKEPGWIIPDELKEHWELILGKSQRKLPNLITKFDSIDFFAHDSEHSAPCMMFEYELAFEWLSADGIIVSDDISWNNSFDTFVEVRDVESGLLQRNVGYILKAK